MPNRYLIANWKMNVPPEGIAAYLDAVKDADIVVAPPFVYLKEVAAKFANTGAQNCADQKSGAFTGEISADMLRDCGARFVIIGHSERRTIYGEDDALIARKLSMAVDAGLTPVLCIGENEQQRERGHAVTFCSDQLCAAAVPQLANANEVIVAYEPSWALCTGRNATRPMVAEIVGAFGGGGSQTAFGARGATTLLHKLTTSFFVLFVLTSLTLAILQARPRSSVMSGAPSAPAAPAKK